MTWSQTASGGRWEYTNPAAENVEWADVAHALAHICRFGGHTQMFYSVAEHCCRVHDWLITQPVPRSVRLVGLLHDAHEFVIGDIPTPLANVLGADMIRDLKATHDAAIFARAKLPYPWDDETKTWVKRADAVMLMSERDALLVRGDPWPDGLEEIERTPIVRPGWFPQHAARAWLLRLQKYGYDVAVEGK